MGDVAEEADDVEETEAGETNLQCWINWSAESFFCNFFTSTPKPFSFTIIFCLELAAFCRT